VRDTACCSNFVFPYGNNGHKGCILVYKVNIIPPFLGILHTSELCGRPFQLDAFVRWVFPNVQVYRWRLANNIMAAI
jgi:hypothetical protein